MQEVKLLLLFLEEEISEIRSRLRLPSAVNRIYFLSLDQPLLSGEHSVIPYSFKSCFKLSIVTHPFL